MALDDVLAMCMIQTRSPVGEDKVVFIAPHPVLIFFHVTRSEPDGPTDVFIREVR